MAATDLHASIMSDAIVLEGGREREWCLQYLAHGIRPRRRYCIKRGRWWWRVSVSTVTLAYLLFRQLKERDRGRTSEAICLARSQGRERQREGCRTNWMVWYDTWWVIIKLLRFKSARWQWSFISCDVEGRKKKKGDIDAVLTKPLSHASWVRAGIRSRADVEQSSGSLRRLQAVILRTSTCACVYTALNRANTHLNTHSDVWMSLRFCLF